MKFDSIPLIPVTGSVFLSVVVVYECMSVEIFYVPVCFFFFLLNAIKNIVSNLGGPEYQSSFLRCRGCLATSYLTIYRKVLHDLKFIPYPLSGFVMS